MKKYVNSHKRNEWVLVIITLAQEVANSEKIIVRLFFPTIRK